MNRNYLNLLTIIFFLFIRQSFGQIVITEFMADPSAVSDASGEWLETVNVSSQQVDINGWHIKDNGTNNHTINNSGPLILNPGGVLVLGNNSNSATNGGVTVNYQYSSFTLANSSDEIIITDTLGNVIDSVVYMSTTTGKSWNLAPSHYNVTDNDNFSYWCLSTTAYGLGDLGTPGLINTSCTSGIASFSPGNNFNIITIANEVLVVHCNTVDQKQTWNIIDLSGRIILSGTISENTVDFSVSLQGLAAGMYSIRFTGIGSVAKFVVF